VVGDDPIHYAIPHHVIRYVELTAIDEAGNDCPATVQLCDDAELTVVQEALDQHAVEFLVHSPVLAVDDILDLRVVGEGDKSERREIWDALRLSYPMAL
jgi:hypothetical protein